MLFFFLACMSPKINKMEQEILEIQAQNAILEARVSELEEDIQEMEEPIKQLESIVGIISKSGFSTRTSTSHSRASKGEVDPTLLENIKEGMKNAPVTPFTISKTQMEMLKQTNELSKMLRIVPHRSSEGYIDGYRLSGIRRGSVPEQLGVKNGDILMAVNGKPMSSMSEAMERYQETQNASSFTFLIIRRGGYKILSYSLEE